MTQQLLAASVLTGSLLLSGVALAQAQEPAWNTSDQVIQIGNDYTDALNTLYAHGFHGVHHLRMQNGTVQALAATPRGQVRHVSVVPGSDQVMTDSPSSSIG